MSNVASALAVDKLLAVLAIALEKPQCLKGTQRPCRGLILCICNLYPASHHKMIRRRVLSSNWLVSHLLFKKYLFFSCFFYYLEISRPCFHFLRLHRFDGDGCRFIFFKKISFLSFLVSSLWPRVACLCARAVRRVAADVLGLAEGRLFGGPGGP